MTRHAARGRVGCEDERHRIPVHARHRGVDVAGAERDDGHAAAGELDPEAFEPRDRGRLGRRVCAGAGQAPEPGHAGDPDQSARAARAHRLDEGLERGGEPHDVRAQDALEGREILGRAARGAGRDARVGDDEIGEAAARDEVRGGRADRGGVGDVRTVRGRGDAELLRQRRERRRAAREEAEGGALPRIVPGERGADAARGPGDEDRTRNRDLLLRGPTSSPAPRRGPCAPARSARPRCRASAARCRPRPPGSGR